MHPIKFESEAKAGIFMYLFDKIIFVLKESTIEIWVL